LHEHSRRRSGQRSTSSCRDSPPGGRHFSTSGWVWPPSRFRWRGRGRSSASSGWMFGLRPLHSRARTCARPGSRDASSCARLRANRSPMRMPSISRGSRVSSCRRRHSTSCSDVFTAHSDRADGSCSPCSSRAATRSPPPSRASARHSGAAHSQARRRSKPGSLRQDSRMSETFRAPPWRWRA
jgi:hypothetical protein